MNETKRILMAKRIEQVVNDKLANNGDEITTKEIKTQISMQKIHNASTKRAVRNLRGGENDN